MIEFCKSLGDQMKTTVPYEDCYGRHIWNSSPFVSTNSFYVYSLTIQGPPYACGRQSLTTSAVEIQPNMQTPAHTFHPEIVRSTVTHQEVQRRQNYGV